MQHFGEMLNSEQNPEWSVARDDHSRTEAGYIIKNQLLFRSFNFYCSGTL
jgi:hypothetical protein